MKKPHLSFLETMITQVCNLSCQGCTNYSDLIHSGYVPWKVGNVHLNRWLEKIDIGEFGIIGGEPMINPEWQAWLTGIRTVLPNARIRFTTNGTFLHKHPDIMNFLENLGNITFKITVHVLDSVLKDQIIKIQQSQNWNDIVEFGIHRWSGRNGIKLQINYPTQFLKTYRGIYENMLPWGNSPDDAFDACCQKTCPLLYNNRIYKCSTSGLLTHTLAKFNYPNRESWAPYIDTGIGLDSSSYEINQFVENFGKPNKICGQCPTTNDGKINHLITVHKK